MILSHRHRLIFLKPRKVAGSSLEIAQSRYAGADDVITPLSPSDERLRARLGFPGPRNLRPPTGRMVRSRRLGRFARSAGGRRFFKMLRQGTLHKKVPIRFYDHIPAALCRELVGAEVWNNYTKISVVRDPWDLAISFFYWREGRDADIARFTDWCARNQRIFALNHQQYMIDGEVVVDRFIRYERLQADLEDLERALPGLDGLWETFSGIAAKGGVRDPQKTVAAVYAEHTAVDRLVQAHNAFEIATFGYRPPGSETGLRAGAGGRGSRAGVRSRARP